MRKSREGEIIKTPMKISDNENTGGDKQRKGHRRKFIKAEKLNSTYLVVDSNCLNMGLEEIDHFQARLKQANKNEKAVDHFLYQVVCPITV